MIFTEYLYFFVFCSMMVFSPGPMTILLMSIGINHGIKGTLPAQLGASSAYCISLMIFAVGLTTILQQHVIILKFIQVAGVIYILYLALQQWRASNKNHAIVMPMKSAITAKNLYLRGLMTGLCNPKTIVLFSTVIPQFAIHDHSKVRDLIILSFTFLILQCVSGITYSYFGKNIKRFLQDSNHHKKIYRIMAVLLILVAIMIARS